MTKILDTAAAWGNLTEGNVHIATELTFLGIIGNWIYVILFVFTLVLVAIKTEEPGMVAIASIIMNGLLYYKVGGWFDPVLWTFFVISLGLVLYSFYASTKYE